jgi:hypothetical protein
LAEGTTPQKAKKYEPRTRGVIKSTSIIDARKGKTPKRPMSRPATGGRVTTRFDATIIKVVEIQESVVDDTINELSYYELWKGYDV